ncbi:MAG: prenyltransferase, partial [Bacteroidota bacterium]
MKKLFHLGRILSLDVVGGALASTYMAVIYLGVKMPHIFWFALALSVWVIYTADHLLDAYRLKEKAHTERHLFHHYHFQSISTVFILGLLICLFVLPFLVPAYM